MSVDRTLVRTQGDLNVVAYILEQLRSRTNDNRLKLECLQLLQHLENRGFKPSNLSRQCANAVRIHVENELTEVVETDVPLLLGNLRKAVLDDFKAQRNSRFSEEVPTLLDSLFEA